MTTSPAPSRTLDGAMLRTRTLRGREGVDVPAKVLERGTGLPIVFLHGLVGLNDHWEDVMERLSGSTRTIGLELPLLGLQGEDCSIHGATDLTARFLEEDLREPAILVGNSFGGHVALKVALEYPHLCRGLVLAGASGLIERSLVREIQTRPTRSWLEEKIGELFYDRSKMNPGDVDRAFGELSERSKARAMVKLSRSARRNHLGEEIHNISAPTLILWGRQDIVTPPEAAEEFKAKIAKSRLIWFDGCGHAPMVECPALFAMAVNEFVSSIEGSASR